MTSSFKSLFQLKYIVDRRQYAVVGICLMALKYVVDASAIYLVTGQFWTPLDYLIPLYSLREDKVTAFPEWLGITLLIWSLPFLWIGVTMTLRRSVDAGRSPWICLLFFVPVINYFMMLLLCLAPSDPSAAWGASEINLSVTKRFQSALIGIGASIGVGIIAVVLLVHMLEVYALSLFVATPFLLGAVCGFLYNYGHHRSLGDTWIVVFIGLIMVGGTLLLFALEGAICLLMAFPIGWALSFLGGIVGRIIAIKSSPSLPAMLAGVVIILPVGGLTDVWLQPDVTWHVESQIDIDAPIGRVWDHVVSFDDIESEPAWYFKLGLAYPIRATIDGTGVEAVRYCEFTTGAFVEPITVWDEPNVLRFSVDDQPPPMIEQSPYENVYAPHLNGFFRAVEGEFRLIPLENGKTRLKGTTWYKLNILPHAYWRLITEAIIEAIHHRVFVQIKKEAEHLPE